jgi:maltooligosyltrehalose trehalohydrolase
MKRAGAQVVGDGVEFTVWAPRPAELKLHIVHPFDRLIDLERGEDGYAFARVDGVGGGTRYFYRIGDDDRPDPASRFQPEGVHGPSEVVGDTHQWTDASWRGLPLSDYVIYELHVGTFTVDGTLDAAIGELDRLRDLGITAVELMPVAQFPGARNWGYDGVYPNAVQNSYGGPEALKRFVDAAHQRGLAVVLDVVYNHLGPEGNYLSLYAPYFTSIYKTPWGEAINFDSEHSDEVRAFFIQNALQWCRDYHIDALRLDAVHAIIDRSAQPFLLDLSRAVHAFAAESGAPRYLIAESDLNDPRLILPQEQGGFGLDAQWADDFHHALHVALTGESKGYYEDFGGVDDLTEIVQRGWLYDGRFSSFRKRRYGAPAQLTDGEKFVVCAQNHDQVGNRMRGDRLSETLDFDQLKVAMGLVLTSPFVPLLFMGEEYAEEAPFRYFTSHSDEALIEAVRKGRAEEFASFDWSGDVPDPHAEETFEGSRLNAAMRATERGVAMQTFVRTLLQLRREHPALWHLDLDHVSADATSGLLLVVRKARETKLGICVNFSAEAKTFQSPRGGRVLIDSGATEFGGDGDLTIFNDAETNLKGHRFIVFEVR